MLLDEEKIEVDEEKNKTISFTTNSMMRTISMEGIYTTGESTGTQEVGNYTSAINYDWSYIRENGNEIAFTPKDKIKNSFVVPGMKKTNVKGNICDDMVPQGITYYDGYFFISAYCGWIKNDVSEHDSVIYVIDGASKKLITTLVLAKMKDEKRTPHAGGIACVNNYLWVGATEELHCYKYSEIKELISYAKQNTNVKCIDLSKYTYYRIDVSVGNASFMSDLDNKYLCVGEYKENENGKLIFYYPTPKNADNNAHIADISVCLKREIPPKAQGVEFYNSNNYTYMLITTSIGTDDKSRIYVYVATGTGGVGYGTLTNTKTINLPRYLEEVVTVGDKTYLIFESCAKLYRYTTTDVIGRVCGFETAFIYK
ncbi:MAG: hypothetical protein E7266_02030 [Lachnospiraceae bacterium]|nr:hypothetical protein [Lachnospiraceae bacterium]